MQTKSLRPHQLVLAGKLVVIVLAAIIAGQAYHKDVLANNEKYSTITVEEYTAGFEDYRAGLQEEEWPLWGNIALIGILSVGFFTLYELLGHGVGLLLRSIVSRSSPG